MDPARIRMPEDGSWSTVRDFLIAVEPRIGPSRIDEMLLLGEIVDLHGPIDRNAVYTPGEAVWFHRDLPVETVVPFDIPIVHRDEKILVIDKPHFLPTIPRGAHILQTALVKLRLELELPELIPAHRLDRVTAGLVLFVIDPAARGAYQALFQDKKVRKTYEAVARFDEQLEFPRTIRSRIVKEKYDFAAREVEGEANAETLIEMVERRRSLSRYRLHPKTGRTHQLRLHMNSLGIPIIGDDLYPHPTGRAVDDFTHPLQLLATVLEFTDPLSGEQRRFESRRTLDSFVSDNP